MIVAPVWPFSDDKQLPEGYGGCHCECHRIPGVYHCVPCCYPTFEEAWGKDANWPPKKESEDV